MSLKTVTWKFMKSCYWKSESIAVSLVILFVSCYNIIRDFHLESAKSQSEYTAQLCYGRILPYLDGYHVILCEVDGHTDKEKGLFISVEDCCEKIEKYAALNLAGKVYGLSGFSMGATIAVELMARNNIAIEKVVLDAAFCVKMGILTPIYTSVFCWAIHRIKSGKTIPAAMVESVMGKVTFWHGSNESYPAKTVKLLKKYLPRMQVEVFEGMGHGQFLNEHPEEYADKMKKIME